METNEKGLYFSARIDTSRLQSDAEKASGILSNIDKQASQESNKIKELLSNVPVVNIDITTNAPTTLSAVAAAFEEIDRVTDTNKAAIRELSSEYERLSAKKNVVAKTGTKDEYNAIKNETIAIRENINLRQKVNEQAAVLADDLLKVEQKLQKEAEATQKASDKTQSLRTQIKALSMQMAEFVANGGDEKSAEYVKMTQELGRLMDIRGDIAKQGSVFANDEAQIAGVIKGVGGLTGAFTAAQGAMSLFVGENENLQKVMLKVQSLMSITMGLQQVQQALNKDSEFRLVTINGLKRWFNKVVAEGNVLQATETAETIKNTAAKEINTAAEARNATAKQASSNGSKEVIAMQNLDTASKATNAAAASAGTVANFTLAGAFRAVGAAIRAIPVWGWIAAAIAAVVAVVGTLAAKANAAKKAANDAFNAAVKKQEDFNKAIADKVSEQITLYNKLKREYTALGNNFKAQKKYIKDNQDAFHSLGVAINGVNDANKYLIQNSSSVVAALMAQAKAAAAFDMLKEKQKELIQVQLKPLKVKNIKPEYELEQDVDRFGNIILTKGKKVKNSGYTQKVLAEQQRAAKAKKAEED